MKEFLRKLFRGETSEPVKIKSEQASDQSLLASRRITTPLMTVGCGQSIGMQRDHNEDAIFLLSSILTTDNQLIPFGLYIVADGMGGHQHGEVASNVAIRSISSHVIQQLYTPLLKPTPTQPSSSLQEILRNGVLEAHHAIIRKVPGGGTTLTAVLIIGNQMNVAHVGDSRAYLISENGSTKVITRDHSLVKRLEELGQLTSDEAAIHPQRNVLYRALGQGEPFEPDVSSFQTPVGCWLLICSDGLWGVVSEEQIVEIIQNSHNPHAACQLMIDAANELGGPDNISAVLIAFPG